MTWRKLGRVFTPDGSIHWARHSFMTPVPLQLDDATIRVFGGMRDDEGRSRIGWIDVAREDPTCVLAICKRPALDLGRPGMFDDNGVILGDVIRRDDGALWMYYVGFQRPALAKFLAFTGLAISTDNGLSFQRARETPVMDRAPQAAFGAALHSILPEDSGLRAHFSCIHGWERIGDQDYPAYNCWTVHSQDGVHFDIEQAQMTLDVAENEYRIGRPRVTALKNGGYELRVTSDTYDKHYACHLATSENGLTWERTKVQELPCGTSGEWDSQMTCYPARIDTWQGETYLFYNGNNMGETGVGVAVQES